jgi:hypothetical protein
MLKDFVYDSSSRFRRNGGNSDLGATCASRLAILVCVIGITVEKLLIICFSDASHTKIPSCSIVQRMTKNKPPLRHHPQMIQWTIQWHQLPPLNQHERNGSGAGESRRERISGHKLRSGLKHDRSNGVIRGVHRDGMREFCYQISPLFTTDSFILSRYIRETLHKDEIRYLPQVVQNPFMADVNVSDEFLPSGPTSTPVRGLGDIDNLLNVL